MSVPDGNIANLVQDIASALLNRFISNVSGIKVVLISSVDGFEIAARTTGNADLAKLSAVSSSLSAIANMASLETELGNRYRNITIANEKGFLVVLDIQYKAYPMILCVTTSEEALLARVIQQSESVVDTLIDQLPHSE